MFGDGSGEHRPHNRGRLDDAFGRRPFPEREQPRRDLRQKRQMIVALRGLLERDLEDTREVRKYLRKNGTAFDNPGVAVGRSLARLRTVDQRDGKPAFRKIQRDRCPDDTRAQNQRINACHTNSPCAEWAQHRSYIDRFWPLSGHGVPI